MATGFWNNPAIEPKRKFRWMLYFAGVPQFIIKTVKKPSFQIATSPHNFLNYEFHYPGKLTWQDVQITLIDPVTPDSAASIYEIIRRSGYVVPSAYAEATPVTISKAEMVAALGTEIRISQLDEAGGTTPIETWVLSNPLITSAEFDNLDYTSDEMMNITLTIKYDWATLEDVGSEDRLWTLNTQKGATGRRGSANYGSDDTA